VTASSHLKKQEDKEEIKEHLEEKISILFTKQSQHK
jgi:hypothetical protein